MLGNWCTPMHKFVVTGAGSTQPHGRTSCVADPLAEHNRLALSL